MNEEENHHLKFQEFSYQNITTFCRFYELNFIFLINLNQLNINRLRYQRRVFPYVHYLLSSDTSIQNNCQFFNRFMGPFL